MCASRRRPPIGGAGAFSCRCVLVLDEHKDQHDHHKHGQRDYDRVHDFRVLLVWPERVDSLSAEPVAQVSHGGLVNLAGLHVVQGDDGICPDILVSCGVDVVEEDLDSSQLDYVSVFEDD